MTDISTGSILKSGEKFVAEEVKKHSTTISLEADKKPDGPASMTVTVGTEHRGEHVTAGAEGWFKREFRSGGNSFGVKGKIEF